MATDIPAYSWTSVERMGREYPPTWDGGGTGVPRVCWSIFAQTSELTKEITKKLQKTEKQHCVASSAPQF